MKTFMVCFFSLIRINAQSFGVPTTGTVEQTYLNPASYEPGGRHRGVDIAGGGDINNTASIYAAGAGKVVFANYVGSNGLGWLVVIYHGLIAGRQTYTLYGHMGDKNTGASFIDPAIRPGMDVAPGTRLGRQGNAGYTMGLTGIHLHWQIQVTDSPILTDGSLVWSTNHEDDFSTADPSQYAGRSFNYNDQITTTVQTPPQNASGTWHADGTLIQQAGSSTVWLLSNGKRRGISSPSIFGSYAFNWNRVVNVSGNEISCRPQGNDLPDASARQLFKGPSGTIYMKIDEGLFAFASAAAYLGRGFTWAQSSTNGADDSSARVITSPWSDGTLIKLQNDPSVYVVSNGIRSGPIAYDAFQTLGYSFSNVVELDPAQFNAISGNNSSITQSTTSQCGVSGSSTGGSRTLIVGCGAQPQTIDAGQSTTFVSSVSGGTAPIQYAWTQNGTNIGTTQNATATYATAGVYTVTLQATDASSPPLTGSGSCSVTVNAASAGTITLGATASATTSPVVVSQPASIAIKVTNSGNGTASNVLIDPEVYDPANQRVFQAPAITGQTLGPQTTQTYSMSWTPPDTRTYTVKVGIFSSDWSTLLYWADQAGTITASNSAGGGSASAAQVNIWWPSPTGITLSGVQPFKMVASGLSLSSYQAFWQVDGGGLVAMSDAVDPNNPYANHKEVQVDLSGWKWRGGTNGTYGPYVVNFVAQDSSGNVIGQQSTTVYVSAQ